MARSDSTLDPTGPALSAWLTRDRALEFARKLRIGDSPLRAFAWSFLSLLTLRFLFAAFTVQYHVDGDNTVSLLQANDWFTTPQRDYFWGQSYMGTTEVWLFSAIWRLFRGARTVPLLYWVFCAQLLFALGSALVQAALVFTDAAFWARRGVFALTLVVIGFGIPVFQKYSFGVGHGYSADPFYSGIAIAVYLFRERLHFGWFAFAGLLLGQSHFIFRLHILFPIALGLSLVAAGPRRHARQVLALIAGTVLGMLPEKLLLPAQSYPPSICLSDPLHVLNNVRWTLTQVATHMGTMPYSLLESEHALWFASRRPLSDQWLFWGEIAGAALFCIVLINGCIRAYRARTYLIFPMLVLINLGVLFTSCMDLDVWSGRRYMQPSMLAIGFLMLYPPWTIWQRLALVLRTGTYAVYALSALMFTTPLAQFAEQSKAQHYDSRKDCLYGSGGDLTALIALNRLRQPRTIDTDYRLPNNYSLNVPNDRGAVRERCRQVFWVDSRGASNKAIRKLCKLEEPYFEAYPTGIVSYPQKVRFQRCLIRGHQVE